MTTSGTGKSTTRSKKLRPDWESDPRHVAMKTILEVGPSELDAWVANVKLATDALKELND